MSDYYISQRDRLLRQVGWYLRVMRKPMVERFGREEARILSRDILAEFDRIIPEIPDVGGSDNDYTTFLVQGAASLAIYRAVQKHGGTVDDAGEIIHQGAVNMVKRIPKFLRHWHGKRRYSEHAAREARESAERSQRREYAADWVVEFVEGDGEPFAWGLDMTECGIKKFLEAQGAMELGPYMCAMDYVTIGALGVELRRTGTLIHGCERCDFRFVVDGSPRPYWLLQFPERDGGIA